MGLRFRKSVKLPLGFRVNFSKSGIGYSYGFKGYRHTVKANGGTRDTFSIPGTGISYVSESGKRTVQSIKYHDNLSDEKTIQYINMVNSSYDSVNNELCYQVNKVINKVSFIEKLWHFFAIIAFPTMIASLLFEDSYTRSTFMKLGMLFIILTAVFIVYRTYYKNNKKININYELDEPTSTEYELLKRKWEMVMGSNKVWSIITSKDARRRTSAGATTSVTRQSITTNCKLPWFIESNIEPICINFNQVQLYMFPDRMLWVDGNTTKFMEYSGIETAYSYCNFREYDGVPADAEIIGTTWQYVNKDGSPDKRFKGNRKVPICRYSEINLNSEQLTLTIMVSNHKIVKAIQVACKNYYKMTMTSKNKICDYTINQKTAVQEENIQYTYNQTNGIQQMYTSDKSQVPLVIGLIFLIYGLLFCCCFAGIILIPTDADETNNIEKTYQDENTEIEDESDEVIEHSINIDIE